MEDILLSRDLVDFSVRALINGISQEFCDECLCLAVSAHSSGRALLQCRKAEAEADGLRADQLAAKKTAVALVPRLIPTHLVWIGPKALRASGRAQQFGR